MFDTDASLGEGAVGRLLFVGERVKFGLFLGRLAQRVRFGDALIARVGKTEGLCGDLGAACQKQFQVVHFARTERGGEDFAVGEVGDDL